MYYSPLRLRKRIIQRIDNSSSSLTATSITTASANVDSATSIASANVDSATSIAFTNVDSARSTEQHTTADEFFTENDLNEENNSILNSCIANEGNELVVTKTIRGKPKLCHNGHYYTIDRGGKDGGRCDKIEWKCERTCNTRQHAKCNGRVYSYGYYEPVFIVNKHNHIPEPEKEQGLLILNRMLERATISNDNPRIIIKQCQLDLEIENASYMCRPNNIRQRINRIRNKQIDHEYKFLMSYVLH